MTTEQELELLAAAFQAVELIWKRVAAAKAGTMSATDAVASIKATLAELPAQMTADDAAADAALDSKFPTGGV